MQKFRQVAFLAAAATAATAVTPAAAFCCGSGDEVEDEDDVEGIAEGSNSRGKKPSPDQRALSLVEHPREFFLLRFARKVRVIWGGGMRLERKRPRQERHTARLGSPALCCPPTFGLRFV